MNDSRMGSEGRREGRQQDVLPNKAVARPQRVMNRLLGRPFGVPRPDHYTVYHCCIQKSASRWFLRFFRDRELQGYTGLAVYEPKENFVPGGPDLRALGEIPTGFFVTPLYVRYGDFAARVPKPPEYRAFYVMRDPRDIVVSDYFSLRYSHPTTHEYICTMREKLSRMSKEDGLAERIENARGSYFSVLAEWGAAEADELVRLFRYEDLFGPDQEIAIADLLVHCRLRIPRRVLRRLLAKHSFERLAGRPQGQEEVRQHYRKGVAGDWRNHFTEGHKRLFKSKAGELLVALGYEKDLSW